jgi:hypothetical protein
VECECKCTGEEAVYDTVDDDCGAVGLSEEREEREDMSDVWG